MKQCLTQRQPRVTILHSGGAQFDLGAKIIMNAKDMIDACGLTTGIVFANHIEALDHCPTTRAELLSATVEAGLTGRILIPEDGAESVFNM